jgi:tetratricopeptide (TPR) repeat protein
MYYITKLGMAPCLWLLLLTGQAYAQANNQKADSLRMCIRQAQNDTDRAWQHLQMANVLRSRQTALAKLHLDTGLQLSRQAKFRKGIAEYHYLSGKTAGMKARYSDAIAAFDSALIYYPGTAKPAVPIAQTYLFQGMCYGYLGKYTQAFKAYTNGLNLVNETEHYTSYVALLEAIANVYNSMGLMEKAIYYYRQMVALAEKNRDDKNRFGALGNIGQTLAGLGRYDEGLRMLNEVLSYFEKTGNVYQVSIIYANIAYIYGSIQQYEKAIATYQKAIDVTKSYNNLQNELICTKSIALLKIKQGKLNEAEQLLNALVDRFTAMENSDLVAETYHLLSQLFAEEKAEQKALDYMLRAYRLSQTSEKRESKNNIALGLAQRYYDLGQYPASLTMLPKVLQEARELKLQRNSAEAYRYLYLNHEQQGEYKAAFHNYKLYKDVLDSLDEQAQINQIERIDFENASQAREKEIQKLAAEKDLKQQIIRRKEIQQILQWSLFGVVLGAIWLMFRQFRNKKKLELRHLRTGLELKALRMQMNPHFIFNSLAAIHGYIVANHTEKAAVYLLRFSQLMRLMLDHSRKPFISLDSEIRFLDVYLQLESARLKDSFDYHISVEPSLPAEHVLIPPMLIHPFVENAVWHGISELKERRGQIQIHLSEEGGLLCVDIADNGVGRHNNVLTGHSRNQFKAESHGIDITKERLELLAPGNAGAEPVLFTDLAEGLRVRLLIPIDDSLS